MHGKIYMIKDDDELVEMPEKKYTAEFDFQNLIGEYPDLIPGDQIDSENPRRWLHVGKEVSFPLVGGVNIYLDHLFLDQDGIPTLVEIKRSEDNRLNREVTAQVIEYGVNLLLAMDVNGLKERVESNDNANLDDFLNDNEDEFWKKVDENLKAENIRLLIVADEIPQRLQNVLEFVNRKMETVEILGVEIKQYTTEDIKTLVPRVIGQSIEAQTKKSSIIEPRLNYETFFETLDTEAKEFYEELFKFSEQEGFKIQFTPKGFSFLVPIGGTNLKILRGFSGLAAYGPYIASDKGYIKDKVNNGDEIVESYIQEMLKIEGFKEVNNGFVFNIDKNLDEKNWDIFKRNIAEVVNQVRKNGIKMN